MAQFAAEAAGRTGQEQAIESVHGFCVGMGEGMTRDPGV
jgi:hypothetical protein